MGLGDNPLSLAIKVSPFTIFSFWKCVFSYKLLDLHFTFLLLVEKCMYNGITIMMMTTMVVVAEMMTMMLIPVSVLIRPQILFSKPLNKWLTNYFLILSVSFYSKLLSVFWDNFENRFFLAWGFTFVLLLSFTKKKTGSVFLAFCHTTFHHAFITCCNVSWAGYIA